jgi:hypothetical protein
MARSSLSTAKAKLSSKTCSFAVANPRFNAFDLLWYHGKDLSVTAVTSQPFGH